MAELRYEPLASALQALKLPVSPALEVPGLQLGPFAYLSPGSEPGELRYSLMHVAFVSDLLAAQGQTLAGGSDSLELHQLCPFTPDPAYADALSRLIFSLNPLLPYGRYQQPPSGAPFLIFSWKCPEGELPVAICLELIQTLRFYFDLSANKLEAVATGQLGETEAMALIEHELGLAGSLAGDLLSAAREQLDELELELD